MWCLAGELCALSSAIFWSCCLFVRFFCFKGFMQVSYNGLAGGPNPIENSLSNRGEEKICLFEATSASPKDAFEGLSYLSNLRLLILAKQKCVFSFKKCQPSNGLLLQFAFKNHVFWVRKKLNFSSSTPTISSQHCQPTKPPSTCSLSTNFSETNFETWLWDLLSSSSNPGEKTVKITKKTQFSSGKHHWSLV